MVASAVPNRDVVRAELLQRLQAAMPRVLAAIAPAGYGKSTLVRQYAGQVGPAAVCDCMGVRTASDVAQRLAAALADGDAARTAALAHKRLLPSDGAADWIAFALDSWSASSANELCILENAEQLSDSLEIIESLSRLLARTPQLRRLALCSREPLQLALSRFFAPHEIVTLRSEDLRFSEGEIAQAFSGIELSRASIDTVAQITRGWPIAVFLMARLAREQALPLLFDQVGGVAFADLYDYLSEQVLEVMPRERFTALLAVAAIPNARADEIALALGAQWERDDVAAFARSSPFLYAVAPDTFEAHPLVKTMLVDRHAERARQIVLRVASALGPSQFLRAAQLYIEAGDQETAARVLEGGYEFLLFDVPPAFAEIVAQLDSAVLLRHPAVWHAATIVRVMAIPHDQWLREALIVKERLDGATPIVVKISVLSDLGNVLTNIGRHAEARAIFEQMERESPGVPQVGRVVSGFYALIDARLGKFSRALDAWHATVPSFSPSPITLALGIVQIEALVFRYRGERATERARLDAGVALAGESRASLAIALALEEAAFAAWFAGEDKLYGQYARRLEESVTPATSGGTEVFRAAAHGNFEPLRQSKGIEHPKIRFYTALIACSVSLAHERIEFARRALQAATEAGEPMSAAVACIACAQSDAAQRDDFIERARNYAAQVDSAQLHEAIEAYATSQEHYGILAPLLRRLEPHAGKPQTALEPRWHISLLRCAVQRNGVPVALSRRELELLAYLSVRKRACRRDEIAEALWPQGSRSGHAAVRVYVNRVRTRLRDSSMIVGMQGCYHLGADVVVDIDLIERDIARARGQSPMRPETRAHLLSALTELTEPRSSVSEPWEWFAPVNVRIDDLMRETATMLARDALESGDVASALELSGRVVERDPLDEPARELVIRAHLASGDAASALREFRIYRETLAGELGARPSRTLESLVIDAV